MKFLYNIFDAPPCSRCKCHSNRSILQSYTIELSVLKCIYQRNNRTLFLSMEQRDDTNPNSTFLIFWIPYLVYHFEESLMRFCQFRSIICQTYQIIVPVSDLLQHFINHIRFLDEQCSKCRFLKILNLIDESSDEVNTLHHHMIK